MLLLTFFVISTNRFMENPLVTDSSPSFSQKLRAFAKPDETKGPHLIFSALLRDSQADLFSDWMLVVQLHFQTLHSGVATEGAKNRAPSALSK